MGAITVLCSSNPSNSSAFNPQPPPSIPGTQLNQIRGMSDIVGRVWASTHAEHGAVTVTIIRM